MTILQERLQVPHRLQKHQRQAVDLLPIVQAHACRQAGLALSPKHSDQ